jgi:hypothetical protein
LVVVVQLVPLPERSPEPQELYRFDQGLNCRMQREQQGKAQQNHA